ncbi:MAG: hypothetical protein R3Y62_02770 [Eubacteriales bacterium]
MSQDKPKGEIFRFEDIMREFGDKPAPQPAPVGEPADVPMNVPAEEPADTPVPEAVQETKTEKPKVIPLPKVAEQVSATSKQAPIQVEKPSVRPRRQPTPKVVKKRVREEAEPLSLFEANKQVGSGGTLRGHFVGFLGLLAVIITICHGMEVPMGGLDANAQTIPMILLAMLLLSACVALDVVKDGIFHMISGKIRLDALVSVAVAVFVIHGFGAVRQGALPFASVGILALACGLSGKSMENRSKKKIYRGMNTLRDSPSAIVVSPDVYEDAAGIHKREGDVQEVVAPMEAASLPERVLGIFGMVVIAISVAVAVAISVWRGDNVIAVWAAILGGSLPAYGLIAFWQPFWKGTCQLAKNGTVLCGWSGVAKLGKKPKPVTTEQDLFTGNQVSVNGMKVYPEFELREIVGYVHAVTQAGGGGMAAVFEALHQQQNGYEYVVNQFKRYDNGGLGAEIQADVVLVGSLGFMKLMGVRMPDGANMKQAVYCSVNGTLAGVFALAYQPSAMVKNAMHAYVRSGGPGLILATKDFILTPAAVRHFYKVPAGWMEYPTAEERAELADGNMEQGETVGLVARMNFGALLEATMVGKTIYSKSMIGLVISMVWGVSGLLLTCVVAAMGAHSVASPFNLTVFALLWSFTAWVLTAFQRK